MDGELARTEKLLSGRLAAFCCALRFLTVLPISWRAEDDGELFGRSVSMFVVVGLCIGLVGAVFCALSGLLLPDKVAAFLMVVYLSAISGFLHLDGLADSGDGLLSHRSREKSLEIMKDSRVGAMGVIVLILVMVGKYAALSSIDPRFLIPALVCLPLAGRTAIVITMAAHPYARPEGGLGGLFYAPGTRRAAWWAIVIMVVALALLVQWQIGLITLLATVFTVFWFGRLCQARLGGVTGDTLGAVCELTELSVAIALTAVVGNA